MHQQVYAQWKAEVKVEPCEDEDEFMAYSVDIENGLKFLGIASSTSFLDCWLMCNGYNSVYRLTGGVARNLKNMAETCTEIDKKTDLLIFEKWHMTVTLSMEKDLFGHRMVVGRAGINPQKKKKVHLWHFVNKSNIAY